MYKYLILLMTVICLFPQSALSAGEDYEIYVAKGIQKINQGLYAEAVEILEKAVELAPDDPEVVYYSAVAYSRTGDYDKAEKLFLKILKQEPDSANIYLELGRIHYIRSECGRAGEYLSKVMDIATSEAVRNYAGGMLDNCGVKEAADEKRMFNVSLTLGGQYDSNVILEPENPAVITRDEKADSRMLAYLAAGAKVYENDMVRLNADYRFYQSIHMDLDDFNVHYHRIAPEIEIPGVSEMVTPRLGYAFEYTMFGGEHYSNLHSFFAGAEIKEGEALSTELLYKYRKNKFFDSGLFESNSLRTGDTNTFGIAQNFIISRVRCNLNYSLDVNDASVGYWDYDSNAVGAEASYALEPVRLNMKASAVFSVNRYEGDYPGYSFSRKDELDRYNFTLTYYGFKKTAVSLADNYSVNKSNLDLFDYERNIIGLFITKRVL